MATILSWRGSLSEHRFTELLFKVCSYSTSPIQLGKLTQEMRGGGRKDVCTTSAHLLLCGAGSVNWTGSLSVFGLWIFNSGGSFSRERETLCIHPRAAAGF